MVGAWGIWATQPASYKTYLMNYYICSLIGGIGAVFVCCIVVSQYYTGGYSPGEDSRYCKKCLVRLFAVCF